MIKLIFLCCLFSFHVCYSQSAAKKPNVIYIYADDLGYGELGSYGQEKIKTPNLDRMAAEGIRFTNHYTGAPVCAPARCMLLTGKHSGNSYIRGNYELGGFEDDQEGGQMPLHEGSFTIGHLMKKAGYVTGAVGKWGLGMSNTTGDPNKQGFDYFYGFLDQKQAHNHYPTHLWENGKWDTLNNAYIKVHQPLPKDETDRAMFDQFKGKDYAMDKMVQKSMAFIEQHKTQPFFLYLPFPSPHVSLQVPDDALQEYLGKFDDKPYRGDRGYASTLYPRATYAAMITYMDKQIGRIMDQLKKLGLDDQTIIMFSSDNGTTFDVGGVEAKYFNSVSGLRGLKQDLYEGGIREPFIVRWPGRIKAGRVTDHISAQFDLMPTLGELTGIQTGNTDGISFLPELLGKPQSQHPYLYFEFPEKSGQVAVRMGEWKGVKSNMKNRNSEWELYNLKNDPSEMKDVAVDHLELVKKFAEIVKKEHRPSHINDWEFINPKYTKKN
jgi:arylsulfatase A